MKRFLPLLLIALMLSLPSWGQSSKTTEIHRCATVELQQQMRAKFPQSQSKADFEIWMAEKLEELESNPNRRRSTLYVPYIVHVVHSGEAIGSGSNISKAAVDAQFKQLNDDFRRENSDTTNTPPEFDSVAAAFDVQFVPALIDPDGNVLAEPGINRINGLEEFGTATWGGPGSTTDSQLKPATIWDRNKYANVWTVAFSGGLLGYATFPEGSTLPGTPGGVTEQTDGVVCGFGTFGSIDLPGPAGAYGLGRTLTHELGHWAGLRHIWGDGDGTDYCDDTPCAGGPNYTGEPCTFPGANSCTEASGTDLPDMFQNFMDYSDDPCFNLFTKDQVNRMEVVFMNSPGREDLLNSTVWIVNPDTIIANLNQDVNGGCAPLEVVFSDNSFVGDSADAITSWDWNFDVDGLGGATPATYSGQNPPTVTFSNVGTYTVSLTITNGSLSGTATSAVEIEGVVELDVTEGFESGVPSGWGNAEWIETNATGNNSSASLYQDNFNNSGRTPAYLTTPSINMDVEVNNITLEFDVAHANFGGTTFGPEEGFAVEISTDCGDTWTEIWKKLDSDDEPFYTVQTDEEGWVPEADEWRTEEIDLTSYIGNPAVRLRFHGISDFGNDTYLDNINITGFTLPSDSIIAEFEIGAPVACEGQDIAITNLSMVGSGISDEVFSWNFDRDGAGDVTPATFTGETPSSVVFNTSGNYTIELIVSSASAATADTFTVDVEITGSQSVPYSEDFESGDLPPAGMSIDEGWLSADGLNSQYSIVADNFNEADLVANVTLPSLDFSSVAQATLSFDLAHAYFSGLFGSSFDTMQISYSLDCGTTWETLWRKDDGDAVNPLYTVDPTGSEYEPSGEDDWRKEEIDVTSLKGNNNVRIRFENRGAFGNQLYIDNINLDAEVVDPDELFALFSIDGAGGCVGSPVTFEDVSTAGSNTAITTWEWNFDVNNAGTAVPSTFSGQTPPEVLFNEPGVYDIELTVGDGNTTETYTAQISVSAPIDLTYEQNFSEVQFPPMGWTNILWEQASQSTDDLLGSIFADNWGVENLKASLYTAPFDLSWYDQIELSFDVAHGIFSAAGNEGLVINASTDCGANYNEIWAKYDQDADPLFTNDDGGEEFFPESDNDWRRESVDLSTLNDYSSVSLEIFNDGDFGNNTFVDGMKVEGWLFNPTDLTATLSGTNIAELSWMDNSEKESAYKIYRKTADMADFEMIATIAANSTSYNDEGLDGSTVYTYKVCAYNEKAKSCSNEASVETEALLVVEGLVAQVSAQSGTSIELQWTDLSTTEDGFLIKRSEDNFATYEVINVLTPNQNYYLDEFLEETTTYTYQVCAFNALDTVSSNTDDATTEINAPTDMTATAVETNVVVSWDDNSLVEEGYQIKRSLTSGGPYSVVATVAANVTSFTDFGLQGLTEYCYVVCAVNATAVACSEEQCVTTDVVSTVFAQLDAAITMYPNPAGDFVQLTLNSIKGNVEVRLFNTLGDVVLEHQFVGGSTETLELNNLASGVYLVRLQTQEGHTTKKLVIE